MYYLALARLTRLCKTDPLNIQKAAARLIVIKSTECLHLEGTLISLQFN